MGPRRAVVLILVHIIIALHIIQWRLTGSTLTPIEPSESMQTLELGYVNAGAIFFALALLSTLIFGRFFCGWGCHIVALQDLCAWLMKKIGVRPKVFRSRLLVLFPLILAIYMFIWPTFKRVVLAPVLRSAWPEAVSALRVTPFPADGFTNHLMTSDFWATFAPPLVAIPFLLICGFATVYFLGAKAFCTYGCPYGGFFAPLDTLAPGRIIVDHDKCHQCGHCTAVCSSNVRVHDEIREYGMVVDQGCMKCMDCVSVCPNEALRFGFARPAVRKGKPRHAPPKRLFDTTIPEDLGLATFGLIVFFCVRGIYGVVPMLMAVGIAICMTYLAWKAYRMCRDANVRVARWQVRRRGRLQPAGFAFLLIFAALLALTVQAGIVNYHAWQGNRLYTDLALAKTDFLGPSPRRLTSEQQSMAERAARNYEQTRALAAGGFGLVTTPALEGRLALMYLALDDPVAAERALRRIVALRGPADELCLDIARLMERQGMAEQAVDYMRRVDTDHPAFWSMRETLCERLARLGRVQEAIDRCSQALAGIDESIWTRTERSRTLLTRAWMISLDGQLDDARKDIEMALEIDPQSVHARRAMIRAILQGPSPDIAQAMPHLRALTELEPGQPQNWVNLAMAHVELGQEPEALSAFRSGVRVSPHARELSDQCLEVIRTAFGSDAADRWLDSIETGG